MMDKKEKDWFVSYCLSYYGKNEIFDIGATKEEIEKAIEVRQTDQEGILREFNKPLSEIEFDGDSIDREMIRDIVYLFSWFNHAASLLSTSDSNSAKVL